MAIATYKYNDMIHRCFRCGYCKFPTDWEDVTNCPAYARFRMESYSAGGRLWLIRAWINGEIEWSEHLADIVYSCTACKNCVEKCPLSFNGDIVNMVVAAKEEMVELGLLPKTTKKFLNNIQLFGNPYGLAAKKRAVWLEQTNIALFKDQEYLFYIGCEGAYDSRAMQAAEALGSLLTKAGVSFGVLGNKEQNDGNEVELLGEQGLLEMIVQNNIARFDELSVKKIITFSPHSYNAFKNIYPRFGGRFEVFHYTQILAQLIAQKSLSLPETTEAKVVFHDPCFLGRWNDEYKAPRKILSAVPGLRLTEMRRNQKGALCCGGGAGNFYTDLLGGSAESPARLRVKQAAETGADLLAVACPNCLTMLEDAVKVEGLEDRIKVRDIAEIVGDNVF